jgi:superfamily II DNA or RNA helicase
MPRASVLAYGRDRFSSLRPYSRCAAHGFSNAGDGAGEQRLILATGSYIGEGFDDARIDTLFLAISWRGTLQQYVGRLHRLHDNKRVVEVDDYPDTGLAQLGQVSEWSSAEPTYTSESVPALRSTKRDIAGPAVGRASASAFQLCQNCVRTASVPTEGVAF